MLGARVDDESIMTDSRPFRFASLVDTWVLRVGLLAWTVLLVVAAERSGPVPRWFGGIAGAIAVAATLRPFGAVGIRRVRFAAGATTASAGAVLTLQLGLMLQRPDVGDPQGFSGAMFLALFTAALGGWIAEERLGNLARDEARSRDELAATRHAELLEAMSGRGPPRQRLRPKDLMLVALALRMLRRR